MTQPSEAGQKIERAVHETAVSTARVHVDVDALSHQGLVRENNEDAFFVFRAGRYLERVVSNIPESEMPSRVDDTAFLMFVADGLGGHEAGDVASRSALVTALQMMLRQPKWALKLDDPATRAVEIQGLFERTRMYLAGMHDALRKQAARDVRLAGMGTTLTGVFSIGADLFVLHVGDSKAYLLHDGVLRKVTHDHTVAQQYADLGVIPQQDVATHRMHHVLTRAVGGPDEELEGDVEYARVESGDRLLLCSDGLTDMATDDEIASVFAAHPASADCAKALVDLALAHGGKDNVTVIVAGYRVT